MSVYFIERYIFVMEGERVLFEVAKEFPYIYIIYIYIYIYMCVCVWYVCMCIYEGRSKINASYLFPWKLH